MQKRIFTVQTANLLIVSTHLGTAVTPNYPGPHGLGNFTDKRVRDSILATDTIPEERDMGKEYVLLTAALVVLGGLCLAAYRIIMPQLHRLWRRQAREAFRDLREQGIDPYTISEGRWRAEYHRLKSLADEGEDLDHNRLKAIQLLMEWAGHDPHFGTDHAEQEMRPAAQAQPPAVPENRLAVTGTAPQPSGT